MRDWRKRREGGEVKSARAEERLGVRASHPSKTAKGGAAIVVVCSARLGKGGPARQRHIVSTLNQLFGPDIELDISTENLSADLNILVAAIPTMTSGEMGEVPLMPDGNPANHGMVDLGQIAFLQGLHHGSESALGNAIGNVIGHELGHELFLPHNELGGLMSPAVDPFLPTGFSNSNLINILNRCLYLRAHKMK